MFVEPLEARYLLSGTSPSLLLAAIDDSAASPTNSGLILAADLGSGHIEPLHAQVPFTGAGVSGLAFKSSGELYGATSAGSGSTSDLMRINPLTGVEISRVSITAGSESISIADLATQPGTDKIYAVRSADDGDGGAGEIYVIDVTSGSATLVGRPSLGAAVDGALAFAPGGVLYFTSVDTLTGRPALYTLDLTSGAILTTLLLPPSGSLQYIAGLAAQPGDGALVASDSASGRLMTIDPTTGARTILAMDAPERGVIGDLAFPPVDRAGTLEHVYHEDFEGGTGGYIADNTGRTLPGYWHYSLGRFADDLLNHSLFHNWYYGAFETPTGGGGYSVLFDHKGVLISPEIQLPSSGATILSFSYLLDTRVDLNHDFVDVSIESGGTVTQILSRPGGTLPQTGRNKWLTSTADLSAFNNQQIRIRFTFDTGDAPPRDPEGWYVDDVLITNFVQLGSIAWEKRDETGVNLLGGARFTITPDPTNGSATPLVVEDWQGEAGAHVDQDSDKGQFLVNNVLLGTYTVTETVAPAGYARDADPDRIVIVSEADLNAVIGMQGTDDPGNTDESDFHNRLLPEIQTVQFITPMSVYRLAGPDTPGSNNNPTSPPPDDRASISGYLWHDVDQDGVWDTGVPGPLDDEPGRSGWTIFIDSNANGVFDDAALITNTADNGLGLIRVTLLEPNTFVTGSPVQISEVAGTTEANGTWTITVIDSTHFDLQGSTFTNPYAGSGVAVERFAITGSKASISAIANNGAGLIRVTSVSILDIDGFATGRTITISAASGTTEANGTWKIIRVDDHNFDLQGSTFTNSYTSGGDAVTVDDGKYTFTGLAAGDYTILDDRSRLSDGTFSVEMFPEEDILGRHKHVVTVDANEKQEGPFGQAVPPNFGRFEYSPIIRPADDTFGHIDLDGNGTLSAAELDPATRADHRDYRSALQNWQSFKVTNTTGASFAINRIDKIIDTSIVPSADTFVTIYSKQPDGSLVVPTFPLNLPKDETVEFFAFYDPATRVDTPASPRAKVTAQFPDWFDEPTTPENERNTRPPHTFSIDDHLKVITDAQSLSFRVNLVGASTYDSDIFYDGAVDGGDLDRLLGILNARWPAVEGKPGSIFEPTSDMDARFPNGAEKIVDHPNDPDEHGVWPLVPPPAREIGLGDFAPLNVEWALPSAPTAVTLVGRARAPFLDLDPDNSSSARGADYFAVEKSADAGAGVRIADFDVAFANRAVRVLKHLTVEITSNPSPGDQLEADTSGTNITKSFVSAVLSLSGIDTVENYNKVLRTIRFKSTTTTERTVEIELIATGAEQTGMLPAGFTQLKNSIELVGNAAVARISIVPFIVSAQESSALSVQHAEVTDPSIAPAATLGFSNLVDDSAEDEKGSLAVVAADFEAAADAGMLPSEDASWVSVTAPTAPQIDHRIASIEEISASAFIVARFLDETASNTLANGTGENVSAPSMTLASSVQPSWTGVDAVLWASSMSVEMTLPTTVMPRPQPFVASLGTAAHSVTDLPRQDADVSSDFANEEKASDGVALSDDHGLTNIDLALAEIEWDDFFLSAPS